MTRLILSVSVESCPHIFLLNPEQISNGRHNKFRAARLFGQWCVFSSHCLRLLHPRPYLKQGAYFINTYQFHQYFSCHTSASFFCREHCKKSALDCAWSKRFRSAELSARVLALSCSAAIRASSKTFMSSLSCWRRSSTPKRDLNNHLKSFSYIV